jgi:hypothetical protein
VLERILARKREEVAERSARRGLATLRAQARDAMPARGFVRSLEARLARGDSAVIAEIKKASPSRGLIRADFDPVALARSYEQALIRTGECHSGDVDDTDRAGFRRQVAQRCLYGVDVNPTAVQLARLPLWLATLAADGR